MDECCEQGMKWDELREARLRAITKELAELDRKDSERRLVMKIAQVVALPAYVVCLFYWLYTTSLDHPGANPWLWWPAYLLLMFSMGDGSKAIFCGIMEFIATRILNVVWFTRKQINKFKNRNNKEIEQ